MSVVPKHIPVLLDEIVSLLNPGPGEVVVDCTAGRGGHCAALAEAMGLGGEVTTTSGRLIAVDLDAGNIESVRERLAGIGQALITIHDSFVSLPNHLQRLGMAADVLLADLGFSSSQMDDPGRGFGFRHDGPLDMRFDRRDPVTAADLVATLDESELARLITRHGEDPLAGRIARKLVQARSIQPILTTGQLARLVTDAYGARASNSRMHPATRTFMALRIAVNDELTALEALLDQIVAATTQSTRAGWLNPGARVAVISFHSLEDRQVKRRFTELVQNGWADWLTPTRRPIRPTDTEQQTNPRARSAKLRGIRLRTERNLGPSHAAT